MVLHTFPIGGPHSGAEQQHLAPDQRPEIRKVRREAFGWLEE